MIYFDLQFILIVANFILLAFLFFYTLYLFSLEKRVKKKYLQLTTKTSEIIEEANKKAIEILKKSEFISEDLKSEIENNFDGILSHIKDQNYEFYSKLKKEYHENSEQIIDKLTSETQEELEKISAKATEAQEAIEQGVKRELSEAEAKFEEDRKRKIEEFESKLKEYIRLNIKDFIAVSIPNEIHEKIVKDLISKAVKEINKDQNGSL